MDSKRSEVGIIAITKFFFRTLNAHFLRELSLVFCTVGPIILRLYFGLGLLRTFCFLANTRSAFTLEAKLCP